MGGFELQLTYLQYVLEKLQEIDACVVVLREPTFLFLNVCLEEQRLGIQSFYFELINKYDSKT